MKETNAEEIQSRDIWGDLLPVVPHLKPPGDNVMLRLIAYDIASNRRWRRVVELCEDYGVRVQFSVFECWLTDEEFGELWTKLSIEINSEEDRIAAYTLESRSADKRTGLGNSMIFSEKREVCFVS